MNLNEMTIIRPGVDTPEEIRQAKSWFDSIPARLRPWYAGITAELTPYVRECCQKVATREPVKIKVEAFDGAAMQFCYANVEIVVTLFGGTAVTGWKIWQIPTVYLNFEHHCVWRNPNGDLVCVTPQLGNEQEIAFLPQQEGTLDEIDAIINTLRSDCFFVDFEGDANSNKVVEFKERQGRALRNGDNEAAMYWNDRASDMLHRILRKRRVI